MAETLFEKLQLKDEKNLLVQGLPSTIEKQFSKLSFAKNVTPLLKIRKIDFALIFALNQNQLNEILKDVIPALHENAKLWIAFPKLSSKIVSDLNRACTWNYLHSNDYEEEADSSIVLDYVWSAIQFKKLHSEKNTKFLSSNKRNSLEPVNKKSIASTEIGSFL